MANKTKNKMEFGDFQTPNILCEKVLHILKRMNFLPNSIIEPACGKGSFLRSSLKHFPSCNQILGFEINPDYVKTANTIKGVSVYCENFFDKDWLKTLKSLPEPHLIIGNPPWITNSNMSLLNGNNLPIKTNHQRLNGFEAISGRSNFDISEWMLTHLFENLSGRTGVVAMLCKTTVARRVLQRAFNQNLEIKQATTHGVNALRYFGAAVDACLLTCIFQPNAKHKSCTVYKNLEDNNSVSTWSIHNNRLTTSPDKTKSFQQLLGKSSIKWRSGIKHDCARIMELYPRGESVYQNGIGHEIRLEPDFLFPMLKSSDLMKPNPFPTRYMLVTQKKTGEKTSDIQYSAPMTWNYLLKNAKYLDKRASSIYRNRPRFSVFGVGDYTFTRWKVAISGFYKKLEFRAIGPIGSKPVVFDDTCYFLHCQSEDEAHNIVKMLKSEIASKFFNSQIFWDTKRPITAEILGNLNLELLSKELEKSISKS